MSFEKEFKKHFSNVNKDVVFDVYNIVTSRTKTEPLIKSSKLETYVRHRLVLVSIPTVGFVCGLETFEYTAWKEGKIEETTVYITKVDAISVNGVVGQLIQAYLASLPTCSVFVFARAQPQYLFVESAQPDKKFLSDRELVSWWLHQLNKSSAQAGWWMVPGIEDQDSALSDIGAKKRQWKSKIPWTYGTSYPPDAPAIDTIPQFDDDAKSRFLRDHAKDNLSVSEFWNLLAFSEECVKTTGFYQIKLRHDDVPIDDQAPNEEDIKLAESDEKFTEFWNIFMSLDFSQKDSCLTSTQKAVQGLEKIFNEKLDHFHVEIKGKPKQEEEKEEIKRPAVATLPADLIKRKKV